jgi:hypothetical protein
MTVTMRGRVKGVGCATGVCPFVELKEQSGEIINGKSSAYFFILVDLPKRATRFPAASPDKIRARGFRLSNAFLFQGNRNALHPMCGTLQIAFSGTAYQ